MITNHASEWNAGAH